jgi:hypothetical protein
MNEQDRLPACGNCGTTPIMREWSEGTPRYQVGCACGRSTAIWGTREQARDEWVKVMALREAVSCSPRFVVVSDLPEWTVWDQVRQHDLFPTTTGNRKYACWSGCSEDTAHLIADALNAYIRTAPSPDQPTGGAT